MAEIQSVGGGCHIQQGGMSQPEWSSTTARTTSLWGKYKHDTPTCSAIFQALLSDGCKYASGAMWKCPAGDKMLLPPTVYRNAAEASMYALMNTHNLHVVSPKEFRQLEADRKAACRPCADGEYR